MTSGKPKTAAIAAFLGDSGIYRQNESHCCVNATVLGCTTVTSCHRQRFSENNWSISAGWPSRRDNIAGDCGKPAPGLSKLRKNKRKPSRRRLRRAI
jgi:hypothetical protein